MECIYRREKLLGVLTFRWCRSSKKRPGDGHSQSNSMQLNNHTTNNSNSQVEEEKTLTRTLVRDRRTNDYAVIVANLYKQYDDSDVVRGIDFAVKQGLIRTPYGANSTLTMKIKNYAKLMNLEIFR